MNEIYRWEREVKGEIDFGEWDAESKVNWHKFSKITFTLAALYAPKGYWTSSSTNIYIRNRKQQPRQGKKRDCLMRLIAEFYSFILVDKRHFRKEPWTSLGEDEWPLISSKRGVWKMKLFAQGDPFTFNIQSYRLSSLFSIWYRCQVE
jgi:hypothetical protein